jgi:hypothetical protein
MDDELNALLKNGTWSLLPSSPSMNIIGCKWVFKVKEKSDGSIFRYKARSEGLSSARLERTLMIHLAQS